MGKHHVHTSMADCLSGAVAIATTESVPFAAKQGKGTGGTLRRQAADALYSLGNGRFQLISAFILGVANCSDCVEVGRLAPREGGMSGDPPSRRSFSPCPSS